MLLQPPTSLASAPPSEATPAGLAMMLTKMTSRDGSDIFMELFECYMGKAQGRVGLMLPPFTVRGSPAHHPAAAAMGAAGVPHHEEGSAAMG